MKLLGKRFLAKRKLPSIALPSAESAYPLDLNVEQIPLAGSRLRLADERDSFGMPRLAIHWRNHQDEVTSIRAFLGLLQSEMRASGCGDLDYEDEGWDRLHAVGGHHIGTTRMAGDRRLGVVDRDCRVFGVRNLYVCSSSVFPTSSHANPVLTLVAMALRLVDHLSEGGS